MTRSAGLLLITAFLYTGRAQAQQLIPFDFTSEEENRLIKENDSLKYFVSTEDTANIVCLNEEATYYKLMDKAQHVLAEGAYVVEGEKFLQQGKWVERYENGRVKNTGYYLRGKPTGTWQESYSTGRPKMIVNYTVIANEQSGAKYCMSGSWQEFFANGKLKTSGHYSIEEAKVKDTIIVEDPISGEKVRKVHTVIEYTPVKAGVWEYYSDNGELEKKEEL